MKRFLILILVAVHCLAMAGQSTISKGDVVYRMVSDSDPTKGVKVYGVNDGCPSKLDIPPYIEINGQKAPVTGINKLASEVITEVDIESAEVGFRSFTIVRDAFSGCNNLEKVTLPSDLSKIHALCFLNTLLKTVVLNSESLPENSMISVLGSENIINDYKIFISGVKLFVPDNSVDTYKNDNSPVDLEGEWPVKGFWSAFDVRPISELSGENPTPVEKPEGVRVPLVNGGTILLLDAVPGHRIRLEAEGASVLRLATFNGKDASAHIDGDVFTVPDYTGVAHFVPVFEMPTSYINTTANDKLDIRISDNMVDVTYDGMPVNIAIYTVDGRRIYDGIGNNVSLDRGVYVMKTQERTFKFAL